jgi:peptidoglycan-N-acetylglucosamine deacetylase
MIVNIHVDCDPLWIYQDEYGETKDFSNTSIYETALPRFLELFAEANVRATFFVIGRDLALDACVRFCKDAISAGHSIGNHTYSHLQNLGAEPVAVRRQEIIKSHEAISTALNYSCVALRCPGYYYDQSIVDTLNELGYIYDSSVLPGLGVYLMKAFYLLFNQSGASKQFGRNWFLFAKRSPHQVPSKDGVVWEFPLASAPLLLLPMHSTFVFQWGMKYFEASWALARVLRPHLVYLFHAVDLLESELAGSGLSHTVATLQLTLQQRASIAKNIVTALSSAPIQLTEQGLTPTTRPNFSSIS